MIQIVVLSCNMPSAVSIANRARNCVPRGAEESSDSMAAALGTALGMTLHMYNNTALAGVPISTNTSAALPLVLATGNTSAEGTGMLTFPSYGRHVRVIITTRHTPHHHLP